MSVKFTFPNGVVVECSTPEEVASVTELLCESLGSDTPSVEMSDETPMPRKIGWPPLHRTIEEKRAIHNVSTKRRFQRLRAQKLCTQCSNPAPDSLLCDTCSDKRRLRRAKLMDEKNSVPEYVLYGEEISIKSVAALAQLPVATVKIRLRKGENPEKIIESSVAERLERQALQRRRERPRVSPADALAAFEENRECVSAAARSLNLPRTSYRKLLAAARNGSDLPVDTLKRSSVVPQAMIRCGSCKNERTREEMFWGGKLRTHCAGCEEERVSKRNSSHA